MSKLYVGNLAYGTGETGLKDAFQEVGEVKEVRIIMDRETGRSKGFGFVTYVKEDDADTAVERMNGFEIDGREILVSKAREERSRNDRGGGDSWRR